MKPWYFINPSSEDDSLGLTWSEWLEVNNIDLTPASVSELLNEAESLLKAKDRMILGLLNKLSQCEDFVRSKNL